MTDNKYNDISNAIFLAAKGLFRTMLEDGLPIPQVQAVAHDLQINLQNALQLAGAHAMVDKPKGPTGPSIFQFGDAPTDDDQPPESNPFL